MHFTCTYRQRHSNSALWLGQDVDLLKQTKKRCNYNFQHQRKCVENRMGKMHGDVRVYSRRSRLKLHTKLFNIVSPQRVIVPFEWWRIPLQVTPVLSQFSFTVLWCSFYSYTYVISMIIPYTSAMEIKLFKFWETSVQANNNPALILSFLSYSSPDYLKMH